MFPYRFTVQEYARVDIQLPQALRRAEPRLRSVVFGGEIDVPIHRTNWLIQAQELWLLHGIQFSELRLRLHFLPRLHKHLPACLWPYGSPGTSLPYRLKYNHCHRPTYNVGTTSVRGIPGDRPCTLFNNNYFAKSASLVDSPAIKHNLGA
jgi:hypothetical protein